MARKAWVSIAIVVGAVLVPVAAIAATGSFSSASSATALTTVNNSTGKALYSVANSGYAGDFRRNATSGAVPAVYAANRSATSGASAVFGYETAGSGAVYGVYGRTLSQTGKGVFGLSTGGTGINFGVYGQTNSNNDAAAGVFGFAPSTTFANSAPPFTNGVLGRANSANGTGVWGDAPNGGFGVVGTGGVGLFGYSPYNNGVGVFGSTFAIGNGSYGLGTDTDLGVSGHVVGGGSNLAGTCTVADGATASTGCSFANPFPDTATVIVLLTPTADPTATGAYWVTNVVDGGTGETTGFVAHVATAPSGTTMTFNYMVVGIDAAIAPSAPARNPARRPSQAQR